MICEGLLSGSVRKRKGKENKNKRKRKRKKSLGRSHLATNSRTNSQEPGKVKVSSCSPFASTVLGIIHQRNAQYCCISLHARPDFFHCCCAFFLPFYPLRFGVHTLRARPIKTDPLSFHFSRIPPRFNGIRCLVGGLAPLSNMCFPCFCCRSSVLHPFFIYLLFSLRRMSPSAKRKGGPARATCKHTGG